MLFRIGLGIILPDPTYNVIRTAEMEIAEKTGNFFGLIQPPNITIKRPFDLATKPMLDKFIKQLGEIRGTAVDRLSYDRLDYFPNGTLYLRVSNNKSLTDLHERLLEFCGSFKVKADQYDSPHVMFHTTLAMKLDDQQISQAMSIAQSNPIATESFIPQQLGIFMRLPDAHTWVLIKKLPLR